jgi:isochorismate pyruvate lyase
MKTPTSCQSLEDVRSEIDRIDAQVLVLLRQRADYVRVASGFKTSRSGVEARDRQQSMLQDRRSWAEREGLDPDFAERLFRDVVAHFVAREMEQWEDAGRGL